MTQIQTISGRGRSRNPELFKQLFKTRHAVFVERLSWSLPVSGEFEIDQYDVPEAQYFYGFNPDGTIRCHVRLTPTVSHSLMADYFPHLVTNGTAVRSATAHEGTRFFVQPSERTRSANRAAISDLMATMFQWAQDHGIAHIQTVIDAWALPQYLEMSSQAEPLGLSVPYGGGSTVQGGGDAMGIRCPTSPEVVRDLRAFGRPRQRPDNGLAPTHAA